MVNNVKAQNFIGNSSGGFSGYLKHKNQIIIGDTLINPIRILNIHKSQNLGGAVISHLDVGIHFSTGWSGNNINEGFDLGYYTGVASTNYVNFDLKKGGQFNFGRGYNFRNGYGLLVSITNNGSEALLTVNGKILAEEIEVIDNVVPDYVFEPEYNLMPISELNNYIKQNKHLPEIPTTEQVEENDIDLGEMNKLLLKKVEELTLYIIELQKQVNELKEKK